MRSLILRSLLLFSLAMPVPLVAQDYRANHWRRLTKMEDIIAEQDSVAARMRREARLVPERRDRLSYDVGAIPFEEGMSPSGARIYSVPIATAASWNLKPSISLVYNSQAGNGVAGYGWNIAGLPCISIRNKNYYYDDAPKGAVYDATYQVYALDGVPIVQSDMGISGYTLATAKGKVLFQPHTTSGRVQYFSALYPDGSTATFGFTDLSGPKTTYPITSWTDKEGNTVTVSYLEDGNCYYVSTISYGVDAVIEFSYDTAWADTPYLFHVAGRAADFPKKLLRSITSKDGSETICQYTLSQDSADGVNLLKSIECQSGAGRLSPLQFTYGYDLESETPDPVFTLSGSLYYAAPLHYYEKSDTLSLQYHRGRFIPGSQNDGIVILPTRETYVQTDIYFDIPIAYKYGSAYPANQQILCNLVNDSGSAVQRVITAGAGFQLIEAVDVNGDGVDELVKVNSSATTAGQTDYLITIYSFNTSYNYSSTSFTVSVSDDNSNAHFVNPAKSYYRFGNFRGDGRPLLLIMTRESSRFALVDLNTQTKLGESSPFTMSDDEDNLVLAADFEGDGKADLCHITSSEMKVYSLSTAISTTFSFRTNYSGVTRSLLYTDPYYTIGGVPQEVKARLYTMDTNGDGYLDIVAAPGLNTAEGSVAPRSFWWNIARFSGKQFYTEGINLHFRNWNDTVIFLDADKDGLPDMLHLQGTDMVFYPNEQGQFSAIYEDTELHLSSTTDVIPGYPYAKDGTLGDVLTVAGRNLKLYTFAIDHAARRIIRRMTDSYGIVHMNEYSRLGSEDGAYLEDRSRTYSWSDGFTRGRGPFYVLYGAQRSLGSQLFSSEFYTYWDAIYHYKGLGFCGFGKVMTRDLVDTVYADRLLNPEKFGAVERLTLHKSISGDTFSSTVNTWDSHTTTYGKLNPRLTQSVETDHLSTIVATTQYTYDSYDFPIAVVTSRRIGSGTAKTQSQLRTYQHSVSASHYILGVVTQESAIREGGIGALSWEEKKVITYDASFHPLTQKKYVGDCGTLNGVTYSADNLVSETHWQYDNHGNVTSQLTAPYGATEYTGTTYTYDSNGRYLLTETDALGHTTTYASYNKWGKPATVTDYRQRSTTYSYDYWGQVTSIASPGSRTDQYARAWGGTGLYTVTRTVTGRPQTVVHYDALDREVRTAVKRFDAQWQKTDKEYNGKGLLQRVSLPFRGTSASYWNTYVYDSYNRPVSLTEASGKVTIWSYSGVDVTTVQDGITSTRTVDANGQVVKVVDAGGTIRYLLRDDGQPYLIYAPGNIQTSFSYDDYGRRISMTDPSAGVQTDAYQWNSDGSSLHTHTNPNGTVKTYRDKYGRITLVERPGEYNTTYTYNSYGLLSAVQSTNGTGKEFTYDSLDRLATEKETVPDSKWLQKTYTYTNGNVLSKIQYTSQNGSITTETYNYANGQHKGVSITGSTTVWNLTSENDLGLPTGITTGSVTRQYGYTAFGLPTYRKMNQGSLQNFSYQFDVATGNLLSRQDGKYNQSEFFDYDSLNRLTEMGSRDVSYAANGNITQIDDAGTMMYGNTSKPYQITSFVPASGGLVPSEPQSITYTSYNRPSTLTERGRTATFTYNEEGERVKMQVTDSTGTLLTRYYIGGRYELDQVGSTVTQRLYLGGDAYSAPMVYRKAGSGSWTAYNIGRDYLGNITQIASKTGTLLSEYSYDPWGRLRNPSTLAIYTPGSEPDLFLGRGFTGHEHLTWFGLVNMNARLYDPLLGRFLSPDPYVQAPDFTQNFNRYSYALNNPLRYTDPDGEFVVTTAIIVGAAIGCAIGMASGYMIGTQHGAKGWEMVGYVVGGGVIGGVAGFAGGAVSTAVAPIVAAAGYGGFAAGAVTGGLAGAASGFISGAGFSLLNGESFADAMYNGGVSALMGMASGALIGGVSNGIASAKDGNGFWTGSEPGSPKNPSNSFGPLDRQSGQPSTNIIETFPDGNVYDLAPNPDGLDNITLYRGLSGSESSEGFLFMSDNPEYALQYGSKLVKVTLPKYTLSMMEMNGDLSYSSGLYVLQSDYNYSGTYHTEYLFSPSVKEFIVNLFTPVK